MKRTTAIILTLVSILLCGCPGLAICVGAAYSQTLIASLQAQGNLPTSFPASIARIALVLVAMVLIAIPVVIGLITLRKPKGANKQPVMVSGPAPVPPSWPPMQQQPAMVSRPAPMPAAMPPAYQPPAPSPEPEPLPPVYQPPAPVPQSEPLPPVYEPPAPAPEPEPLPPVYQPPEPEPLSPVYEPLPLSMPPVQEQPPAPAVPAAPPPEDQPEEAASQVFPTTETPFPPMMEEATRLASNWCLVFVSGPNPVKTVLLGKKISVGRSPENDVIIADPMISRQHAIVELVSGGYQVTDLGSANGTSINDVLLTGSDRLKVGDLVKFGGTVFRLQPVYDMG